MSHFLAEYFRCERPLIPAVLILATVGVYVVETSHSWLFIGLLTLVIWITTSILYWSQFQTINAEPNVYVSTSVFIEHILRATVILVIESVIIYVLSSQNMDWWIQTIVATLFGLFFMPLVAIIGLYLAGITDTGNL